MHCQFRSTAYDDMRDAWDGGALLHLQGQVLWWTKSRETTTSLTEMMVVKKGIAFSILHIDAPNSVPCEQCML